MFEIYNRRTNKIILSGLTYDQLFKWRMFQIDRWDLIIHPVTEKEGA